ncbi:MAG: hypothetical protein PSN04_03300 [Methyloprofundus sp.]|nr:hypothetical protein [Methyloprofundus sp.]
MKRLPPYAKNIPADQDCIIFCTGSDAWYRAKSKTWPSGLHEYRKTLLPLNDDINAYKFSFAAGRDVILFSNGVLETYDRLIELSRALLAYKALTITWCIPAYSTTTIIGRVSA